MKDHPADEIEHYLAILAKNPSSRAFAQLGDAYRRQGRCADAIAVCERGLERYPNYAGARMILARALLEQGDLLRAEAEFRRVLDQVPDNIPAHRALGDLLHSRGREAEALAVYEALLDLTPFDREAGELAESLRTWLSHAPAPAAGPEPSPAIEPAEAPLEVPTYDLTESVTAPPLPLGPPVELSGAEAPASPPVLATETLADLYVQQGFADDARAIYQELLRLDPAREDLRSKLASLEAPAAPASSDTAGLEPEGVPVSAASDGGDAVGADVAELLEAWLATARAMRAERGPR